MLPADRIEASPKMAVPSATCSVGLACRVDVQHDVRHLVPIRTFAVGVEQPQICDEVFVVIMIRRERRPEFEAGQVARRRHGWRRERLTAAKIKPAPREAKVA
jgi:hypothetical protein